MRNLLCCIFLFVTLGNIYGQSATVSGTVRDASNGQRLAAATIRIAGTPRGTITNADGDYKLSLWEGKYVLIFSYVGFKTDSIQIDVRGNVTTNVELVPSPIQVAAVVVTGEDPAIGIMRRVIENKQKWIEKLRSYELDAFTRQVIRRDTAIAMISESYSTCYWQRGDTLREVVTQKRQTENIKGTQNFAGVGGIVNFYDDTVRMAGFKFLGPTSPNAFDYYDFKLERTRHRTGSDIYDIRMIPKTRLVPLFRGTISIAEGSYAVAGIRVSPNEAFVIPFISALKLTYQQQFSLFDKEYWMPVDIRTEGFFQVGIAGLTLPGIGIESISSIYDCKVNPAIPDSIFHKPRRVVLKEADTYDSTFWAQRDVLPLTEEEKIAYHRLDSTQTLEKQFQPSGPLVTLTDLLSESPFSPQLRFDRVEGLFLGAGSTFDSVTSKLKVHVEAGYGFADKRAKGRLGIELFLDKERNYSVGAEAYRDVQHFHNGSAYGFGENFLPALLYKIDYFDYYYTQGITLSLSATPRRDLAFELGFRNEDQNTAVRRTNYSLLSRDRTFEPNPAIEEGTLREVQGTARYGQAPLPIPVIPRNYLQCNVNVSSSAIGSSYDYTQVSLEGEYHVATYLKSLFLPPTLMVKMTTGTSIGTLPIQQFYYFDAPLTGYAPNGVLRGVRMKEVSSDTYVLLFLEHNFRSVPFLWLNIPYLYRNSIELLSYVNVAQSWNLTNSIPAAIHPTSGIYAETGIGINRILGLLRLDVTYRLTRPQRWVVTMGAAMLL